MPLIPCALTLKQCLPCNDSPIGNLSAEGPDRDVFIGFRDFTGNPPLGDTFFQLGCKTICFSEVSQEEADLCAERQARQCVWETFREPQPQDDVFPDGPSQAPQIFLNAVQSCSTNCPDGTSFGATIAAGTVAALSQLEADRIAASLACNRARQQRICITTTSPLNAACLDTEYSKMLTAKGGTPWVVGFNDLLRIPICASLGDRFPYVWEVVSGSLPVGLELDECSGIISGIPLVLGTISFTVKATDYIGSFQTKTFSLTVTQITNASPLPDASIGAVYLVNFATGIGDQEQQTWTVISGSLPAGLTLTAAGVLSGTPTTSGISNFTVKVVESGANGFTCEKAFELEVTQSIPTFYWTLDDTVIDSIASRPLLVSTQTYAAGIINNGFRFALSGQPRALETSSNLSYTTGNDFSFSFWIKWTVDFDANDTALVKFDDGIVNDAPDIIVRWLNVLGVRNIELEVATLTEDSTVQTPFTVNLGQQYFFTVVYDATTGIATLYQDTVAILTTTPIFLPSVTTNRIAFWSNSLVLTANYVIDETGWWFDHKLTAQEITFLYNSGSANRPPGV